VYHLHELRIPVIVHIILYLPNETKEMMLDTIHHLNSLNIQGVKLHLLHILKDSALGTAYLEKPFFTPTLEEYVTCIGACIGNLNPDIVIHRLTGDAPQKMLLAPTWSLHKRHVLNTIQKHLKIQDIWQGKYLP